MSLTISPAEIVEKSSSPLLQAAPGWSRVEVGEVASVLNGAALKSEYFNTEGQGLPLVRIRDVGKDSTETSYSGPFEDRHLIRDGDLLVGMDGDFRIAEWHGGKALLNQRVCKLSVEDASRCSAKFLLYILPGYLDEVHRLTSSVTVKHLSSLTVKQIPIPLPLLHVQDALVEEIEKQFTRLDAAVGALHRTRTNLTRYQRAYLRDVFSFAGASEDEWKMVPLGSVCSVHVGATPRRKVPAYWGGQIPWVVSQDLHSRYITETKENITQTALDNSSTQLHPEGTLLLGMIGQGPTRGLPAILRVPACTSQNLAAIRPLKGGVLLSEWLMYFFDSQYDKVRQLGSGNNQKALNKRVLESIEVPLPSLEEQHKRVELIDRQISILKECKNVLDGAVARERAVRQSVLELAFSGQLATD